MGSGTPGRASPNELKEVKAKLVNVQFDLKERDIRIQSLMNKLLTLQSSLDDFAPPKQGSFTESSGTSKLDANGDSCEVVMLRGRLIKAEDELKNARSDVERLQTEKNEAEVAGKGFMERYVSTLSHGIVLCSDTVLLPYYLVVLNTKYSLQLGIPTVYKCRHSTLSFLL